MWEIWAKALGSKAYDEKDKADRVAIVRSILIAFEILVGIFIILNAIQNHGMSLFFL